ncbi:hypothetical protein CK203_050744 [Vitis vinifera]|uniref:Uncharacterized protein n=1 Tax=Vitis vinifera TaxID=29760 RepID=A0A438HCI9_VITVI|nr:hypothetical protein CK203_050744 [Vitis vinifera]
MSTGMKKSSSNGYEKPSTSKEQQGKINEVRRLTGPLPDSTWIESIPDHHLPEPSHFSDSSTQPSIWGPTPNQTTKAWQHLQARRTLSQKSVAPLKIFRNPKVVFSFALIFIDALLLFLIITFVPYTKIDWDAYMSQSLFSMLQHGSEKGPTLHELTPLERILHTEPYKGCHAQLERSPRILWGIFQDGRRATKDSPRSPSLHTHVSHYAIMPPHNLSPGNAQVVNSSGVKYPKRSALV